VPDGPPPKDPPKGQLEEGKGTGKKYFGLPAWAWGVGAGMLAIAYFIYRDSAQKKQAAAAAQGQKSADAASGMAAAQNQGLATSQYESLLALDRDIQGERARPHGWRGRGPEDMRAERIGGQGPNPSLNGFARSRGQTPAGVLSDSHHGGRDRGDGRGGRHGYGKDMQDYVRRGQFSRPMPDDVNAWWSPGGGPHGQGGGGCGGPEGGPGWESPCGPGHESHDHDDHDKPVMRIKADVDIHDAERGGWGDQWKQGGHHQDAKRDDDDDDKRKRRRDDDDDDKRRGGRDDDDRRGGGGARQGGRGHASSGSKRGGW
jgi:hypothetical protein